MPDWRKILRTVGEVMYAAGHIVIINDWLNKTDEAACDAIDTFVTISRVEEVDSMDNALLHVAATNANTRDRRRLLKFYAAFKVAETTRFGAFRGFPD